MTGQGQRGGEMLCYSTPVTIRPVNSDPSKSDHPPSHCSGDQTVPSGDSNQTEKQTSIIITCHIYIFYFTLNFY